MLFYYIIDWSRYRWIFFYLVVGNGILMLGKENEVIGKKCVYNEEKGINIYIVLFMFDMMVI